MVAESSKHQNELDELIKNTKGFQNVQHFDPHLTRILITELIWGKGYLKPENARAIRIILELENELRSALDSIKLQPENESFPQITGRLITFSFVFSVVKKWSQSQAKDFTKRSLTIHHQPSALCSSLVWPCSLFQLPLTLPQFVF